MLTLHNCDAYSWLRTAPSASVDAIICDPPYGTGGWQHTGGRVPTKVKTEWDQWDHSWLEDGVRVSRGAVGLFCPAVRLPDLLAWVGGRKWRLFFWAKSNPRPQFNKKAAWGFEPFVVIGDDVPCSQPGKLTADYLLTAIETRNKLHPYQKPQRVMEWLVAACCPPGGTVLDPFCGGGSTGVACLNTGRGFVGIERDPGYFKAASERLKAVQNRDGGRSDTAALGA